MSGRNNFDKLRKQVLDRPGAAARVAKLKRDEERELTLGELRRARAMTQTQLADVLETTQPGVSRIERQTDLYLSTLRSYVQALGGDLELIAVFPDGAVPIRKLEDLAGDTETS